MTPGEHLVLIGQEPDTLETRALGFQLRDTITILLPGPKTLFAFLFRAPLNGTVADNVLKHGCGGLQIDRCRVFTDWQESDRPPSWKRSGHTAKPDADKIAAPPGQGIVCHPKGRWPSNLVLVHGPGCVRTGEKKIRSSSFPTISSPTVLGVINDDGWKPKPTYHPGFADSEGKETVAAWDCQPDCPVGMLDGKSGNRRSAGLYPSDSREDGDRNTYRVGLGKQGPLYEDVGGASRFYPQFPDLPAALDWLTRLALLPGEP